MPRRAIITLALRSLSRLGASRWLAEAPDAGGVVVTLHHVAPRRLTPFAPNGHLSVTPEFLDDFLGHFAGRGWRFVSLQDLLEPTQGAAERRIAVTLDDGFRDNRENAWPVFRRRSVPFTIFICPGFCDRTAELWWEALERIVAGTDAVSLPGGGPAADLSTRSLDEKRRAFRIWADWLTGDVDETRQRLVIRALAERYSLDLARLADELVMSWDEVREIAADPLCTIGAHTMTHPALARLQPHEAFREMQDSAERIAAEIGRKPSTIAFPYGMRSAAGPREAELAAQAGFAGSFTTQPGYIPITGARQGLPRVSLNGYFQDLDMTEILLQPGLWRLRDRVRRLRGRLAR
jgi:peptidoglycan/xylan/chitin deacetylase (PgdA/CDA1 family)